MDELGYLAEYDPECFAKTCKNVVYNIPETKSIMEPIASASTYNETELESSEQQNIEKILENLKRLELNDFPVTNIDVDKVKSLLGNIYMELLFPHNDKDTFIKMTDNEIISTFDKKA